MHRSNAEDMSVDEFRINMNNKRSKDMLKKNKIFVYLIGGVLVLAAAAGVLAFAGSARADAGTASWVPSEEITSTIDTQVGDDLEDFNHGRGRHPGMPDKGGVASEFLAEALGISVEELQEAQDAASQAALDQALAEGLITQDQYDRMVLGGVRFHGKVGGDAIDYQALLAEALGIDIEALEEAQAAAQQAAIDQALADGILTQEQVDMMRAREALKDYVDPNAILAEALGLTEAELDAAREDGKSTSDLLSEQGLTAVEVRDAMDAAYQAAIQQAVEDGVITAEQAELFLNDYHGFRFMAPGDCMPGGGFDKQHGRGGFPGMGAPDFPGTDTGNDL